LDCLSLYVNVKSLKSLYCVCKEFNLRLSSNEVITNILHRHGINVKTSSFWDMIFHLGCKYSYGPYYRTKNDATILAARTGDAFNDAYTSTVLIAIAYNNSCVPPKYRSDIEYYRIGKIASKTNIGYYGPSLEDTYDYFRSVSRTVIMEHLLHGRVFRDDLQGVVELLDRYNFTESINCEYGRCSLKTIEYLLSSSRFDLKKNVFNVLGSAISYDNRETIHYILDKYREVFGHECKEMLYPAIMTLNIDLVYFVMGLYTDGISWKDVCLKLFNSDTTRAQIKLLFSLPGFCYNETLVADLGKCNDKVVRQVLRTIPLSVMREWNWYKVVESAKMKVKRTVRECVKKLDIEINGEESIGKRWR